MTPTELVQTEICRFLTSRDPEVLCVSGEWGVGKTFTWQRMFDGERERVALKRYAYVSLFGINSLEELKLSVFENSESVIGQEADQPRRLLGKLDIFARKSRGVAKELPYVGNIIKNAGSLFFLTVRDQLICIDDLDRRGANLRVQDVLGLISFLREQRKCKVALLLNDKALGDAGEKEFRSHFEKVIDVELRFAPEPEDSVRIALPGNDLISQLIGGNCITLRISNIRVIKIIERFVRNIAPLLERFDSQVLHQAAHTLTLLAWGKYQPEHAPSLSYLKSKRDYFGIGNAEEVSAQEAAWNALIDVYGFRGIDEFDLSLAEGIDNGFFNPNRVQECAAALAQKIELGQKDNSFSEAWDKYHDSFDDDATDVLDTIYHSFKENVQSITPMNVDGTVRLLKDLRRGDQAIELIRFYVEQRREERSFWDIQEYAFHDHVTDPDLLDAFRHKLASFRTDIDPKDLLLKIGINDSWHDREIETIAALSVEQFYTIFKAHKGRELSKMISGALRFDRIANASEPMREIVRKAKEALARIGEESSINARRVRKFGINIEN